MHYKCDSKYSNSRSRQRDHNDHRPTLASEITFWKPPAERNTGSVLCDEDNFTKATTSRKVELVSVGANTGLESSVSTGVTGDGVSVASLAQPRAFSVNDFLFNYDGSREYQKDYGCTTSVTHVPSSVPSHSLSLVAAPSARASANGTQSAVNLHSAESTLSPIIFQLMSFLDKSNLCGVRGASGQQH